MPLRSLRYPITPSGLHYLLIHYDVPEVNADEWRLKVGGQVARPFNLTLEEIKKRPSQTIAVTMECAGNGRALFAPRRISQPWLLEAIGTAKWTGTPLWGILEEAGIRRDAVEVVFTGLDRGVEGDQVQFYQRSLIVGEARREEVLLVYEMNGEPLPPQHGYPLRLLVPGWYGMASVKWLDRIEAVAEPGIPDGSGLSLLPIGGRSWRAGQRDQGARADGSPWHSRFYDPDSLGPCWSGYSLRESMGRSPQRRSCGGERRRWVHVVGGPTGRSGFILRLEDVDVCLECSSRRLHSLCTRDGF